MTPPPSPKAATVEEISWTYAPGAIRLGLVADGDLNVEEGIPRSLAICVFQLSDVSWFLGTAGTRQGLDALLACQLEGSGVVGAERRFIQPGERKDLILDRLEKTRYLAVAAGYADMSPARSVGVMQIPIKEGRRYLILKGFFPEPLEAWIILKGRGMLAFPKDKSDYGRSAADLPREPKEGEPALTKEEAMAERKERAKLEAKRPKRGAAESASGGLEAEAAGAEASKSDAPNPSDSKEIAFSEVENPGAGFPELARMESGEPASAAIEEADIGLAGAGGSGGTGASGAAGGAGAPGKTKEIALGQRSYAAGALSRGSFKEASWGLTERTPGELSWFPSAPELRLEPIGGPAAGPGPAE